jgi:group I intron endonuclease
MSKSKVENSGIYKITNLINNKCYIGSSVNCKDRIRRHESDLIRNKHHSQRLQNSFNKHGINNFSFEIIEEIEVKGMLRFFIDKLLIAREQYYIDSNLSFLPCYGYNIKRYAEHKKNKKMTEEEKQWLRQLQKGKPLSKYHYQRMMEGMKTRKTHIPTGAEIEKLIVRNKNLEWTKERRLQKSKNSSKLTDEQIINIRTSKLSNSEICNLYGITTSTVCSILSNKLYKWVVCDIEKNRKKKRKLLSAEEIQCVINSNDSVKNLAKKFDCSYIYIKKIKNRNNQNSVQENK